MHSKKNTYPRTWGKCACQHRLFCWFWGCSSSFGPNCSFPVLLMASEKARIWCSGSLGTMFQAMPHSGGHLQYLGCDVTEEHATEELATSMWMEGACSKNTAWRIKPHHAPSWCMLTTPLLTKSKNFWLLWNFFGSLCCHRNTWISYACLDSVSNARGVSLGAIDGGRWVGKIWQDATINAWVARASITNAVQSGHQILKGLWGTWTEGFVTLWQLDPRHVVWRRVPNNSTFINPSFALWKKPQIAILLWTVQDHTGPLKCWPLRQTSANHFYCGNKAAWHWPTDMAILVATNIRKLWRRSGLWILTTCA